MLKFLDFCYSSCVPIKFPLGAQHVVPTFPSSTSIYPISFDVSFTLVKVSFHVSHSCTIFYFLENSG